MKQNAFTLIELLISICVVGIIISLCIVSSSSIVQKNEGQVISDELTSMIDVAKIKALTLGSTIRLAPIDQQAQWAKGIEMSYFDISTQQFRRLHQWAWHHPQWTIEWFGAYSHDEILFANNITHAMSNGRFLITNIATKEKKIIVVNRLGRVKSIS